MLPATFGPSTMTRPSSLAFPARAAAEALKLSLGWVLSSRTRSTCFPRVNDIVSGIRSTAGNKYFLVLDDKTIQGKLQGFRSLPARANVPEELGRGHRRSQGRPAA